MTRRRRIARGVATALVLTAGLVAGAWLTGIPPVGRVRIELFEPRDHSGTHGGPASDAAIISRLGQADPAHWGGSFVRDNALVVTYVDVPTKTAQTTLTKAGVSSSVRLESRSTSLAAADVVRGRIQTTGLIGTRLTGLGYDAERGVVTVDAKWPDVALLRKLDKATAGTYVPVRIHWTFSDPRAA